MESPPAPLADRFDNGESGPRGDLPIGFSSFRPFKPTFQASPRAAHIDFAVIGFFLIVLVSMTNNIHLFNFHHRLLQ